MKKIFTALSILMKGPPPREVPEGLSGDQYYELGKRYKLAGWIAQSKRALRLAIVLDPDGAGKSAQVYLNAYLPRNDIPEEAVRENIAAVNQSLIDRKGAEKAYRELIEKYPDFEWPYGNLGHLFVEDGRLDEAKEILGQALSLNPQYTNGLIHLAAAHWNDGDQKSADDLLRQVLAIDPHFDSNILLNYPHIRERLEDLSASS
ncbi:MAG: tetratricopeptide repeat protein [Candidatus Obscuribacterales bacterium]